MILWNWCCRSVNSRDRSSSCVVGDHADLRVFQRHGVAGVAVGADAVQAQQFAGHLEAGDLVAAVLGRDAGLEEAGAHRVERLEVVAGAEQRLAARHRAARGDHGVQPVQLLVGHAHRQAQLAQVAAGAGDLEGLEPDAAVAVACMGFRGSAKVGVSVGRHVGRLTLRHGRLSRQPALGLEQIKVGQAASWHSRAA